MLNKLCGDKIKKLARILSLIMNEEDSFEEKREKLNELVLEKGNLEMKRFFNLDTQVYREGALTRKTKELLGLVASIVLRCDDCIEYHMRRCHEEGVSDEEMNEALSIALVVGGSITIPHIRELFDKWQGLKEG